MADGTNKPNRTDAPPRWRSRRQAPPCRDRGRQRRGVRTRARRAIAPGPSQRQAAARRRPAHRAGHGRVGRRRSRICSHALGIPMPQIIKILMGLGQMRTATQSLADDEVELIAAEVEREIIDQARSRRRRRAGVASTIAERISHRGRRSSRSWATSTTARRRCSTRSAQTAVVDTEAGGITQHIGAYQAEIDGRRDHLPRHAGPRGVHRHARPRREGHRHRRARRRRRRRRHAADEGVDLARARRRRADRRRGQQDRRARREPGPREERARRPRASSPRSGAATTQFAARLGQAAANLDELLEKILLVADAELDLTREPERARRPARSSSRGSTSAAARSRRCSSTAARSRRRRHRRRRRLGQGARALRLPRRARQGGAARASPSRSSASTSRRRRASSRASSRTSARRKRSRREARPSGSAASSSRSARSAASRSRRSSSSSQAGRGPGPQHRPQGRRAGLGRGARRRARQDPARRGARQRHPHRRRRHHRERRQPRRPRRTRS